MFSLFREVALWVGLERAEPPILLVVKDLLFLVCPPWCLSYVVFPPVAGLAGLMLVRSVITIGG